MAKDKAIQLFFYEGKNSKNQPITGNISAINQNRAIAALKKKGIYVKKIKTIKSNHSFKGGNITSEDITIFMRQLATMLTAGLPLVQSLQAIMDGVQKQKFQDLLKSLKENVESGIPFSEALKNHPKQFDELVYNLIAAGELSGNLDKMLARIAVYKERSEFIKKKIKKAMYYPIAVICVAIVVSAILLLKVVPTFKALFSGFGAELPPFTLFVLQLSELLQEHAIKLFIAFALFSYFLFYSYRNSHTFRNLIQRLMLKLPIMGKILNKAIIARFARTLSTTFAAGVPLTDALLSVAKSSGNIVFFDAIVQIKDNVAAGQPIKEAMQATGIFPSMVVQMIAIGEESGSLEDMLTKVAVIYEQDVDATVDGLASLLEPLIMVILGVLVGSLVIAMYLPIFKLGSIL